MGLNVLMYSIITHPFSIFITENGNSKETTEATMDHSLDTVLKIQLGSKLQYKCKGKKQCRGFVCVRTGDGNSAFVRCKGPNCKNWFNRKPFDFNKCSLACASGYRTLKCY